jgi:hypothetical protein
MVVVQETLARNWLEVADRIIADTKRLCPQDCILKNKGTLKC